MHFYCYSNHNTLKREVRSSPTKILWGLGAAVSPSCFTYRRLGEGPPGLVNLYVLRFDQVVVFLGVGVLWIFVGCFCWINMFFFGKNGWNLMEPVVFFVGRFTMIVNGLPQFQGFAEFTVSFFLKFHQMVGKLLVETANIWEWTENNSRWRLKQQVAYGRTSCIGHIYHTGWQWSVDLERLA